MNKVWLLIPSNNEEYDCFEGFVVVAPSKQKAIELATAQLFNPKFQLPFKEVAEVDLSTQGVILSAFKAG